MFSAISSDVSRREGSTLLNDVSIVIDSHNDSIVTHMRKGGLPFNPTLPKRNEDGPGVVRLVRDPLPHSTPIQLNVPTMRAGGVDVAYFAIDVTRARNNHLAYALDGYGFFDAECQRDGSIKLVTSSQGMLEAKATGRLGAVLVMENSDGLAGSLHVLRMIHRIGVRVIGFTHNPRSDAADGVGESDTGGGLTLFGRELVQAMNDLGMLIDVAHLSERGFWDVLERSNDPIIASHACCRALCDHPRNLTDEQLRALAQTGGVVGITFVPFFVHEHEDAASFERLIDHIEHAIDVAGPDHVGIGSDFDGGGTLLGDAGEFPAIATALKERGHADDVIHKVMGQNHFRLFQRVCG